MSADGQKKGGRGDRSQFDLRPGVASWLVFDVWAGQFQVGPVKNSDEVAPVNQLGIGSYNVTYRARVLMKGGVEGWIGFRLPGRHYKPGEMNSKQVLSCNSKLAESVPIQPIVKRLVS